MCGVQPKPSPFGKVLSTVEIQEMSRVNELTSAAAQELAQTQQVIRRTAVYAQVLQADELARRQQRIQEQLEVTEDSW